MSFPNKTRAFVASLSADHAARDLMRPGDPIVPPLEFFLGLSSVPGFESKLRQLQHDPKGTRTTNDRRVKWAACCAELGAIALLGETLKLPITGFDQEAPKAMRKGANCDITAEIGGVPAYFEVKRKAAEDKQELPEDLEIAMGCLQKTLGVSLTVELRDRSYNCGDLRQRILEISEHARRHSEARGVPSWQCSGFAVTFGRPTREGHVGTGFTPDFEGEIGPYLFGPAPPRQGVVPMVPAVDRALEKGADYLVARVPHWRHGGNEWQHIVKTCLPSATTTSAQRLTASDPRLGGLGGVVLFARFDDYVIIDNGLVDCRMWLP